jgi:signal transduction histidine kinase
MKLSFIRWRLPISYAAIALITAVVLGGILLLTLRSYYREQERSYLANSAQLMSGGISQLLEDKSNRTDLQVYLQNLSFLIQARVRLLDSEKNILADSGSLQSQQFIYTNLNPFGMNVEVFREGMAERYLFRIAINILDRLPEAGGVGINPVMLSQLPTENTLCGFGLGNQDTKSLKHTDQAVQSPLVSPEGKILGTLEISEGLAFGGQILNNVAAAWGISSLVAILVAAVLGFGVSRRMTLPLTDLTMVTRRMSSGDLSARAHVITRDEFGILGDSFNTMADRVEDLIKTLRSFIADAAHELHTPLTTLRMNLELTADDDRNRQKYLDSAQSQVMRLQILVDSLLDLSRIEAGKLTKKRLSISKIIAEIAEKVSQEAARVGITFSLVPGPAAVEICGDESNIRRALDNLLDNSVKFTPSGGSINLRVEADQEHVQIVVTDTGVGIPAEDLPFVFRRFHRGRNAVTYPGSGLGLAIVKTIVDQHGGDLTIESNNEGTTATIILPKAE